MDTIGERIKQKRKELNLTQLQLAEKLQVTDRAVSKWEQGEGNPDFSLLASLAEILNVTLDYLITGKEEESVSIDDMDEIKRASYICKKDDVNLFKKYLTAKDNILLDSDYHYQNRSQASEAKLIETIKTAVIENKSLKIFSILLDSFLTLKTVNELGRQNNMMGFCFPAYFLSENLDDIIKMCATLGRTDALDTLKVKWYSVSDNKSKVKPNNRYDRVKEPCSISRETFDYILNEKNVPSKVIEYFSDLVFWSADKPRYVGFDQYETYCVYSQMNDLLLDKFYKEGNFKVLNNLLEQYNKNLSKNLELFNERIERAKGERYYNVSYKDGICRFRNTYNSGNPAEIFGYVPDIKLAYESAKTAIDREWLVKFNDYRKTLQDSFGVETKTYMSDIQIDRYFALNNKNLSEAEKRDVRCLDNRLIVVSELQNTKDLKFIRKILDNNYITYYEFAYDSIKNNKTKELFKFLVDNKLDDLASTLMLSKTADPDHQKFLKKAWLLFTDYNNKSYYSLISKQYNIFDFKVDPRNSNVKGYDTDGVNRWVLDNCGPFDRSKWESREKFYEMITDLKSNKVIDYIKAVKEKIYNQVVDVINAEKQAEAEKIERAKIVKGLSKEYFDDLLAKGGNELFIIKLCALLDAIFKFDYHYEGDDYSERMNAHFKNLEVNLPKSRDCDDGWGYMVLDQEYEETVVKPAKDNLNHLRDLFYRLRISRNNIAHSESNKIKELSLDELREAKDYVFSINKVEA